MANELKDVLRVEGSETGIYTSIRERQNGYTIDGSDPHKIIHKFVGGTYGIWSDDTYTLNLINSQIALSQINDENVVVNISYASNLTNQELVNAYLLRPTLSIVSFTQNQGSSLQKGQTTIGATGTNPVVATFGLTGAIDSWWLRDYAGTGLTGIGATGTYNFSYVPYLTPSGTYAYTLSATDIASSSVSSTIYVDFKMNKYYGTSASATPNETIIEAGTATLSTDTAASKTLSTVNITGGGNYIYYAYPAAWGALTNLYVNGFLSGWNVTTVSVTNGYSNTENYTVYTSPNQIVGGITLAAN